MLENFKDYLILNVSSKQTIKTYYAVMSLYFSKYKEYNQENVNNFFKTLIENEKKASYINKCIAVFKKYNLFIKKNIELPKTRKQLNKKAITLTKDEIEDEILPYFPMLFKDYEKRRLIFRFLFSSCLRISELCNLKKSDINFDTGIINVIGKGNKRRQTYIHPQIFDELKEEVSKSKTESALNITKRYVSYIMDCINTQLNYKKHITPHTLRHAGARFLRDSGIPIEDISDILGHSNLNTTKIYLNYENEEIQKRFNLTKFIKN